jgi:NitT/TauT family transport system substrate-binding protein
MINAPVKTLALSVILLTLVFCSCQNAAQDKTANQQGTITVATLRGPAGISMVHMMDQMKNLGGDTLDYQIKNEPLQVRPLLFQEKATFGVVPTNMAAILYNKGVPYQLAAVPVWGTLYLFGEDEHIRDWEDLKGRKIYLMAKGMTPDVMFRYLLEKNGLDPQKDVELDYSFPTHIELANAVASGKARLAVISEPMVSMVMNKNNRIRSLISLNEAWKEQTGVEIPQTALLVHQDFANQHPGRVKEFLQAYEQSVQWINRHPEEGARGVVRYGILNDTAVARASIPRCNMRFKKARDVQEQVTSFLEIFYQMNPDIVGGKIPDENFYFKK